MSIQSPTIIKPDALKAGRRSLWQSLTGPVFEKEYRGEGWAVRLPMKSSAMGLAKGEKSLAVWALLKETGVYARLHLFRFGQVVLHDPDRLGRDLAEYFCEKPVIPHSVHLRSGEPSFPDKKNFSAQGLIELRLHKEGNIFPAVSMPQIIKTGWQSAYHLDDGINLRDVLALYYSDPELRQIYVLALTYPAYFEPGYLQQVQEMFFKAAGSFKIMDRNRDQWNGFSFTPPSAP